MENVLCEPIELTEPIELAECEHDVVAGGGGRPPAPPWPGPGVGTFGKYPASTSLHLWEETYGSSLFGDP